MKFFITTSFDSPYKGVANLTLPILMEYADCHGYELSVKQNPWDARDIIWGRVSDMLAYNGPADWIVHVDADVLITNLTKSLEEFVGFDRFTLIVVGSDHNGINDGMLFLRNSLPAKELMRDVERTAESGCFQSALAENESLHKFVSVASQRSFNSYLKGEYPDQDPDGVWQEGDFALHLPGRSNPRRVEILNQILPLIKR